MLRQIRYFQAVVRCHSFSEAAEECHISQSAISQQVKALENELGFALLERKNRSFALTPAGEHFYRKSLVLMADYERLRAESAHIAQGEGRPGAAYHRVSAQLCRPGGTAGAGGICVGPSAAGGTAFVRQP